MKIITEPLTKTKDNRFIDSVFLNMLSRLGGDVLLPSKKDLPKRGEKSSPTSLSDVEVVSETAL